MNIYVGNLNFQTTEDTLRDTFAAQGHVTGVRIIIDDQNRSKGFGFVDMPDAAEAERAMKALDGTELEGRTLKVSEARNKGR